MMQDFCTSGMEPEWNRSERLCTGTGLNAGIYWLFLCRFSELIPDLRLYKAASLELWLQRAPQQGGFQLSWEIESRSSGWRTVTPSTTPPCWPGQQQYMVQCGTGTIRSRNEMFKWRGFSSFSWNVWRKCTETVFRSFLGSSRQSSLAGLPITKKTKKTKKGCWKMQLPHIEKHEGFDIMRGDVRIPFSVQHNVGSVENLDGVIFFSVSITTSHILQVSCTVLSTVNENQPGRGGWKVIGHGEEIIDGNKGAGQPQWSREVDFFETSCVIKKEGAQIWFKGCVCCDWCQR